MADITIGIAFIAGLVSFISPCVLPLVPAYVGYMGGQVTTQVAATAGGGAVAAPQNRFNTLIHGRFIVLGVTFVFVTFGLLTTAGSLALRGSVVDVQEILARWVVS
jgi:cytochrome c-type biogenesis protein